MSFGSRLRERREALNLKQGELGKMLGITGSAIGNYENGVSSPKADILYKVFDVLQCDANYLFQDEMSDEIKTAPPKMDEALLSIFHELNQEGKEKVIDYAGLLADSGQYKKYGSSELGKNA